MATPIFICGGECGITVVGGSGPDTEHWSAAVGGAAISSVTAPASRGGMALRYNTAAGTAMNTHTFKAAIASPATIVARFYVYFTTLPSADTRIWSSSGIVNVNFESSDSTLRAGGVAVTNKAASGAVVTTGVWYRVDVKGVRNTTTTCDISVDGSAQAQYSVAGAAGTLTTVVVGVQDTATADMYIDDLVVSGTTGDFPLGEGRVTGLYPNADGTHNYDASGDFEKNGNSSDPCAFPVANETTSWQSLVNPLSTTTDTAKFIIDVSGTNTQYMEWAFDDLPAEADTVQGVMVTTVNHSISTTANNVRSRLNDNGNTSGYVYGSAAPAYVDFSIATPTTATKVFPTAPSTGSAWTTTLVDGLKFQWGLSSDVAPDPILNGVCLEVAYTEAAGDVTANAIAVAATALDQTVTGTTLNTVTALARTTTVPQASATLVVNDFNRGDGNAIGNPVTLTEVAGAWETISNRAVLTTAAGSFDSVARDDTNSFATNDQYASVKFYRLSGTNNTFGGVLLRYSSAANTGYAISAGSDGSINILSIVTGTGTLAYYDASAFTFSSGALIEATVEGSLINVWYDGVQIVTDFFDDSIASGPRSGITAYTDVTQEGALDDLTFYDLPSNDGTATAIAVAVTTTRGTPTGSTANTVTAQSRTTTRGTPTGSTANTVAAQSRTTVRGTPTGSTANTVATQGRTTVIGIPSGTIVHTVVAQARTAAVGAPAGSTANTVAVVGRTTTVGVSTATGDAVGTAVVVGRTTTVGVSTATGGATVTAIAVGCTTTVGVPTATGDAVATAVAVVRTIAIGTATATGDAVATAVTAALTATVSSASATGEAITTAPGVAATVFTGIATATGTAVVDAIVVAATAVTSLASAEGTTGDVTATALVVAASALDQPLTGSTANTVTGHGHPSLRNQIPVSVANTVTAVISTAVAPPAVGAVDATADALTVAVTVTTPEASATTAEIASAIAVAVTAVTAVTTATGGAVGVAVAVAASTVTSLAVADGTAAVTAPAVVAAAVVSAVTGTGDAVATALVVVATVTIGQAAAIGEGTGTATAVAVAAVVSAGTPTGGISVAAGPVARTATVEGLTGGAGGTTGAVAVTVTVSAATASEGLVAVAGAVIAGATVTALSGGAGGTANAPAATATLPQPGGGSGGVTVGLAAGVACSAPSGGAGGTLGAVAVTTATPSPAAVGETVGHAGAVAVGTALGQLLGGAGGTVDPVAATVTALGLVFFSGVYPGGVNVDDEGGPGVAISVDDGGGVGAHVGGSGSTVDADSEGSNVGVGAGGVMVHTS